MVYLIIYGILFDSTDRNYRIVTRDRTIILPNLFKDNSSDDDGHFVAWCWLPVDGQIKCIVCLPLGGEQRGNAWEGVQWPALSRRGFYFGYHALR